MESLAASDLEQLFDKILQSDTEQSAAAENAKLQEEEERVAREPASALAQLENEPKQRTVPQQVTEGF